MDRPLAGSGSKKKGYCFRHGSGYSTLSLLVGLCPKSSVLLPGFTLVASELIHELEWEQMLIARTLDCVSAKVFWQHLPSL